MNSMLVQEVETRMQNGHHAYIAFLEETPVAYGWVATQRAGVREIGLSFILPSHNRYLWDFQTLPPWRGRGIYPHFLQEILRQEMDTVERFWILYKPGETAAERSIRKAGFLFLGELVLTSGRVSGITLFTKSERAQIGAIVLGLPIVSQKQGEAE